MKAVIHTGQSCLWAQTLGPLPWLLLPAGNRPLLEYWLELCVDLGIRDVWLVLGEGADRIEAYAGDGERWGLCLHYSFLRADHEPDSFLRRTPEPWYDGLLYVRSPSFPRRPTEIKPVAPPAGNTRMFQGPEGPTCLLSTDAVFLKSWIDGAPGGVTDGPDNGLAPCALTGIKDYYDLNMALVGGEISRYVAPGYLIRDGSCIGYNVSLPPTSMLSPPILVGNDVRVGAMAALGPDAVIGNHVVIDREAVLTQCVVLDGTYVGRGVEIRGRIVAGRRLIDPSDGVSMDIEDPWLVAGIGLLPHLCDGVRFLLGVAMALVMAVGQAVPFILLYPMVAATGARFARARVLGRSGRRMEILEFREGAAPGRAVRIFRALSLDIWPHLGDVLRGRFWLCGQRPLRTPEEDGLKAELPEYFPAVFSYVGDGEDQGFPAAIQADALYYLRYRSMPEDLRIGGRFLWTRLLQGLSEPDPHPPASTESAAKAPEPPHE